MRIFFFSENDCPAGFKKYQKSCYYFSNGKKTFDDAASACQSMSKNATLISIHSHFEQGETTMMLPKYMCRLLLI